MADKRGKDQTGNLGQFIKQQRTMRGLTLEELGALSGLSPPTWDASREASVFLRPRYCAG